LEPILTPFKVENYFSIDTIEVCILNTFRITKKSFRLLPNFPLIPRIVSIVALVIAGIVIQIVVPINNQFPYELPSISIISFIIGLVLLIGALILVFPANIPISEIPKTSTEAAHWEETTMKKLSDYFNVINKRHRQGKRAASFFDIRKRKAKLLFILSIFLVFGLYLLLLYVTNRLYPATLIFLVDIYLFLLPIWFAIKVDIWEPDVLRKILFYYQFTRHEELDELEFRSEPAVELREIIDEDFKQELFLPTNVRFDVFFDDAPESFDSLSIQIVLNKHMGNLFPFFVCFLRFKKPAEWMPLKKDEALADRIVKIKHILEEDEENLHTFVLSKSPKAEHPYHTSPKEATKIFKRAHKMLTDFG
jgi:hypothetical protein